MNTLNVILFFLAIILAILLLADSPFFYSYGEEISLTPQSSPIPTVTPTPTPIPHPVTLIIPKLAVQVPIDSVGMDAEGKMNVPFVDMHVAWFSPGYKPGEQGNAVIAGHYDTIQGTPSVFYNLAQLQPGDEIFILDAIGQQRKFVVRGNMDYDVNNAPLDSIFGSADTARLNLITCSGWFNTSIGYSHRRVVYTELVE